MDSPAHAAEQWLAAEPMDRIMRNRVSVVEQYRIEDEALRLQQQAARRRETPMVHAPVYGPPMDDGPDADALLDMMANFDDDDAPAARSVLPNHRRESSSSSGSSSASSLPLARSSGGSLPLSRSSSGSSASSSLPLSRSSSGPSPSSSLPSSRSSSGSSSDHHRGGRGDFLRALSSSASSISSSGARVGRPHPRSASVSDGAEPPPPVQRPRLSVPAATPAALAAPLSWHHALDSDMMSPVPRRVREDPPWRPFEVSPYVPHGSGQGAGTPPAFHLAHARAFASDDSDRAYARDLEAGLESEKEEPTPQPSHAFLTLVEREAERRLLEDHGIPDFCTPPRAPREPYPHYAPVEVVDRLAAMRGDLHESDDDDDVPQPRPSPPPPPRRWASGSGGTLRSDMLARAREPPGHGLSAWPTDLLIGGILAPIDRMPANSIVQQMLRRHALRVQLVVESQASTGDIPGRIFTYFLFIANVWSVYNFLRLLEYAIAELERLVVDGVEPGHVSSDTVRNVVSTIINDHVLPDAARRLDTTPAEVLREGRGQHQSLRAHTLRAVVSAIEDLFRKPYFTPCFCPQAARHTQGTYTEQDPLAWSRDVIRQLCAAIHGPLDVPDERFVRIVTFKAAVDDAILSNFEAGTTPDAAIFQLAMERAERVTDGSGLSIAKGLAALLAMQLSYSQHAMGPLNTEGQRPEALRSVEDPRSLYVHEADGPTADRVAVDAFMRNVVWFVRAAGLPSPMASPSQLDSRTALIQFVQGRRDFFADLGHKGGEGLSPFTSASKAARLFDILERTLKGEALPPEFQETDVGLAFFAWLKWSAVG